MSATTMVPPAPPAAPGRADAQRNRTRLLDAALALITEDPGDAAAGFTLDDVARRAGIGPATLYRHFGSRRVLISALFERDVTQAVQPHIAAAMADGDPWRGLTRALDATIATVVEHRAVLRAGHDIGMITPEMGQRFTHALGEVLSRGQAAGSVRTDARAADLPVIVGMVAAAARHPGADWRRFLGLLLDGLRTTTHHEEQS